MKKHFSAPIGATLVVLSSVVYASYGVWIVLLGNFLGDFTQAVIRSSLVAILILIIAVWRKQLVRVEWGRDRWIFLGLLISSALVSAPMFYSMKVIGVSLGTAIAYAGIILGTFIFGKLILGEKYTKDKMLATALGVLGLWLVFSPTTQTFGWLGLLAALVSGMAVGLNMVLNKKMKYNATQTTLLMWTAAAVVNLPLVFIFSESLPTFQLEIEWLYLLIFVIASLVASNLLVHGLKLIEAGAAGILGLLEIVFGVIFGVAFFKEELTLVIAAGMLCIISAAAIPYVQNYNAKKRLVKAEQLSR